MNEQNEPVAPPAAGAAPGGGGLQFDRAEFGEQPARECSSCQSEIRDAYFTINGHVACAACHGRFAEHRENGLDMRRFSRAAIFGLLAGALGSGIYYAVLLLSGHWAIIAILIGWMVGKAVSNGSRRCGGWLYQLLAVGLTYAAIASSYVPFIFGGMRQHRAASAMAKSDAPKSTAAKTAHAKAAAPDAPAGKAEEEEAGLAGAEEGPKEAEPTSIGPGLLLAIIIAFIIPIRVGIESPLLLFIVGIGLYEAWKLNKRVVLDIQGPFHVAPPSLAEARPSGA
ncbi:MAG: hypothetical protein ABSE73_07745 [Planctomycetota bacterium]